MAKLEVILVNEQNGEVWPAEVIVDHPVGLWIDQILKGLELERSQGGQIFYYQFVIEKSGRIIREDQTLQSAGVCEGDTLRLERDKDFSPLPTATSKAKSKAIPWKLIAYAGSLMIIIIGVFLKMTINKEYQKSDQLNGGSTQTVTLYPSLVPTEKIATNTPISPTDSVQNTKEPDINNPDTWPVFVYDTFELKSENWNQGKKEFDKTIIILAIENGVYQIDASTQDGITLWLVNSLDYPQDVYYSADINLVETPANEDFGLIFRQSDGGNYGGFGISNDGKYIAYFKIDNEFFKPIDWKPSSYITKNGVNSLAVLIVGDSYSYYINGNLVGQTTESRLQGSKYGFGFQLRIGETALVEFDNFQIRSMETIN